MSASAPRTSRFVLLASVLLLLSSAAIGTGQEFRGTILGRVSDPDGGVLPGATVVVVSESTGVGSKTVTQSDGVYAVRFLVPGTYRVEVEMPGFSRFVRSGITLAIGQNASPVRDALRDYVDMDKYGGIKTNPDLSTRTPGIFASGDIVLGPSSIIEAVGQAKACAASVHRYLMGIQGGNGGKPVPGATTVPESATA